MFARGLWRSRVVGWTAVTVRETGNETASDAVVIS